MLKKSQNVSYRFPQPLQDNGSEMGRHNNVTICDTPGRSFPISVREAE
jgi:hypothetical protein